MAKMMLGRKLGMTQIFEENGTVLPVTAVQVGPLVVVGKKSANGKDGYSALQLGFEAARKFAKEGDNRYRGLTKAQVGVFAAKKLEPMKVIRELRVDEADLDNYEIGQVIPADTFAEGDIIDVSATSKGRGFSGVMKRHNFAGFKASHGVHESYRGGGAIGMSADPARVFKGMKMPGRYGGTRSTVQNQRLVRVVCETSGEGESQTRAADGVYLIRGQVPGAIGGLVEIRAAVKKHR